MKDLGGISNYLGININQNLNLGTIEISQTRYLKNVLKTYGMLNCKPVSTPMDPKFDYKSLKLNGK